MVNSAESMVPRIPFHSSLPTRWLCLRVLMTQASRERAMLPA